MENQLKEALEELQVKTIGKSKDEIKSALDAFEVKHTESLSKAKEEVKSFYDETIKEMKEQIKAAQDHSDALDIKLKEGKAESKTYAQTLSQDIKANYDSIKGVRKGQSYKMELKVVGTMTSANNLTGDVVFTYQPGVAAVPNQLINVSDLVPTVQSATGLYSIYRETGSEGSISAQTTPGVSKTQIDYDVTQVNFTADYIAGYVRVAKQMLQDLPFLQSFLPMALRRDYFKAENSEFATDLLAAATASTATGTELVEKIFEDIAALESADYMVNGIAMNPADWYTIAVTKPNDFSLPGVVNFQNGILTMNGIPVYKVTWLDAGEYIVGDWTQAKKVVTDGLGVEFFEQDQDNVIKNLITVRVECRCVLAIDRPDAFIKGVPTT